LFFNDLVNSLDKRIHANYESRAIKKSFELLQKDFMDKKQDAVRAPVV